ncbi:site-specific DNA-methyltransferase [Enterococcus cecorum]|uniref:site-specific DNA-methyltransferase n=3 Tax=Enterococcus cecorum TaxID=44008 RepID=UPI001FAC2E63|nr:site-specific DNA-methyltransferase [Enterococcus cecorum]MCJ0538450.1 site-specific DNA-methyltransferase [Enterococcus cecorum]MCJ0551044.1 site-specific DNA-methyltransferase [Enterococcus cecorum]
MLRENLEYNKNVKANSAFLEELKLKLPEFFTAEKKDDDGNVVEESKFDYLKFKKMLDEQNIEEFTSGYQLDFIGKNYAKKQSGERPKTVIVPDIEHNTKMENKNSKNIFLTGDNLEVLRHLKQNYNGIVDVIYIDPLYNTGKKDDFVYQDKFEYDDETLRITFGLTDDELSKLQSIQGSSSHSAWLTFMYPRLYLAKKLLKSRGMIFVSIDENEFADLKILLDDIFGESCFIGDMIRKTKSMTNDADSGLNYQHEYVFCYAKNINSARLKGEKKDNSNYKNPDNDINGPWIVDNPSAKSGGESTYFEIINPYTGQIDLPPKGRYWAFSQKSFNNWVTSGKIIFKNKIKNGERGFILKKYLTDLKSEYNPVNSLFSIDNKYMNQVATKEFINLMGDGFFSNPKPTEFIKKLLQYSTLEDSIIIDFFAGSGTTADAVMQLNAEDGGNRKFILCTLPEKTYTVNADGTEIPTKGGTVAYEAGYKSIDEISRERIKRAAEKIKQENPDLADSLDLGFKHYRVVSPSVETLEDIEFNAVMQLDLLEDMISKFSSENLGVDGNATGVDTILQTYLVQDGYKFDVNIEYIELGEYKVPYINNQRIYIISNNWNNKATEKLVNMIGRNEIQVQTIVVYGYSFDAKNLRTLEYALNQLDNKVNLQIRY